MPIVTAQYTLSNVTAVKVVSAESQQQTVLLHNGDHGSHIVYIGNSGVTSTNGMHIDAGQTITLSPDPGSELWAVSSHDAILLTKLAIKQD